jgi:cholesterol transport system auxiliary component
VNRWRRRGKVNRLVWRALVFAAIGLAACTGSLFQSKVKPPTIYLLSAGAASPASASTAAGGAAADPPAASSAPAVRPALVAPVNLTVLKPRLRPGLETDRIAVLYPDRHLDYFADARWSGPLGEVIQDLAVQEFRSHANLARVSGDASVFGSAYWLEIEVADFQAEYTSAATAPTVHVNFLARLGGSGDRRILGQFVANVQRPAAENRLTAIVDAYEHAADAALAQIAALADQTLAKISEAR